MMRRTLLLGGVAVAAGAGWALTQGIFATGDVAMTYEDFRTRAMADLAHDADDLISFTPATTPFFQEIRSTALAYLPLMMRLVDDPTVPVAVKFGASAAMLDLPVVDLTAYLAHLVDYANRPPVASVLRRLWEAPDLPAWARAEGTPLHDLFASQ